MSDIVTSNELVNELLRVFGVDPSYVSAFAFDPFQWGKPVTATVTRIISRDDVQRIAKQCEHYRLVKYATDEPELLNPKAAGE